MPDARAMLLPSRACLMSVRDTLCVARRDALAEAVRMASETLDRDSDRAQAATLACLWEATACMELAANVAAPWVDPQIPAENGGWVEMTRYDPSRANRFYESSHKWDDDRYSVLSGHVFIHGAEHNMLEMLAGMGLVDPNLIAAYEEAQRATASFLRDLFVEFGSAWRQFRPYAAAYEHGLLFVPAAVGDIVDEDESVIPHALMTFHTRQDASMGHAGDGDGLAPVVATAKRIGEQASDVADYVADARLRSIEPMEFEGDKIFLRPWSNPFPYWFRRGAVSGTTLELLQQGITVGWLRVEDDADGSPRPAEHATAATAEATSLEGDVRRDDLRLLRPGEADGRRAARAPDPACDRLVADDRHRLR